MRILSIFLLVFLSANTVLAGGGEQIFVVNSTLDEVDDVLDGSCSTVPDGSENRCTLRAAIQEANDYFRQTIIQFDIDDAGCVNDICTITIDRANLGSLPDITEFVTIDGSTQPGNSTVCTLPPEQRPDYKIVLQGDSIDIGLRLEAGSDLSVIRGLNIRNFLNNVAIINSTDTRVECNLIGTDESGMVGAGSNTGNGIIIGCESNNTIIGGPNSEDANVISDNDVDGIQYFAGFVCPTATNLPSNNAILGNYIGVAKDGITPLGNVFGGISFFGGPAFGHYIGTLQDGITMNPNIIGNSDSGIFIGDGSNNISIKGNYIGTDRTAMIDLGNTFGGVDIFSGVGNEVGDIGLGEGNIVAFNGDGVFITGADALANQIRGNVSINNSGAAIEIVQDGGDDSDGLNPNDTDDIDMGANNLMNHPDIVAAEFINVFGDLFADVELRVDATLANATYPLQIDFYFEEDLNSNLGSIYADSGEYTVPQAESNIIFSLPSGVSGGYIQLTATDASGNTSEMSPPVTVGIVDLIFKDGFEQ